MNATITTTNGHVEEVDYMAMAEAAIIMPTLSVERKTVATAGSASLYDPPIIRREINELLDDLLQRAELDFSFDVVVSSAERLDVGAGELLASIMDGHMLFDHTSEQWYFWNNLHWQPEEGEDIYKIASDILTTMYRQACMMANRAVLDIDRELNGEDPDAEVQKKRKAMKRIAEMTRERASSLYRRHNVDAALRFARATMFLGVMGETWDTDIDLLGVQNGTVRISTGKAVQPDPKHYIRIVAPVTFDPNATCRLWDKSILEIFDGDKDKPAYIQRLLGYAMTGTCHESDFFILHGNEGRNGKEFILERVRNVLGDTLSGVVESELLIKQKFNRGKNASSESLMTLRGRRLAWASETDEGQQMDLSTMKDLSGGHYLTGRHNYEKAVTWKRTHTILLLTNFLPHINSQGLAEWDRIKVLTFPLSFVNNPDPEKSNQRLKDKTLGERIDKSELPGVFNWLLRGAAEWRNGGLREPASVIADTAAFKGSEDTLGIFISECCVVGPNVLCKSKDLFSAYKDWLEGKPMGKQTFFNKIRGRGFNEKVIHGSNFFGGIGVRQEQN